MLIAILRNRHNLPRWLIPFKPDWKKPEEDTPFKSDYYESRRALGALYRNVQLLKISKDPLFHSTNCPTPLSDPISQALIPYVERFLGSNGVDNSESDFASILPIYRRYVDELRYIRLAHALSESPDSVLDEEEIVLGAILANCSQSRLRKDRTFRMRLHTQTLVMNTRNKLYEWCEEPTAGAFRFGLSECWRAWDYAMRRR